MKIWIAALKVFGYAWLTLGTIAILMGIVGIWMTDGFPGVQELLSPFNVVNYGLMLITLAPGAGMLIWADKLAGKQ